MSSIIIEYDLRQPGRDYDALYNAIKSYEAWAHGTMRHNLCQAVAGRTR